MKKGLKIGIIVGTILIGGIAFVIYKLYSHRSDVHLKLIPKNAAAVVKIDIKELAMKADVLKLLQQPGFKNSGNASLNELISDPFATGIDPIENVYAFISKQADHQDAAIVFNVDDAAKLETFENKLHIAASETTVESGIYYSPISETECIAWNDDAGILLSTSSGEAKTDAIAFLNQSKENSILENPDYKTFADKTFDVGMFFNNRELSQMSGTEKTLSSLGMSDGHGEIIVNFENDKISAAYTNYASSSGLNNPILKKTGPDAKQFNAISTAPPLVYLGVAADMTELFTVIKNDPDLSTDLAGIEMGFGINETTLRKLFTGDISLSFTDFKDISDYDPRIKEDVANKMKLDPKTDRSYYSLNTPMCYLSIGETDDVKMGDMLANSGMEKIENFYAMPGLGYIVYVAAKDGHLLITNDYFAAETLSEKGTFSSPLPKEISTTDALSFYTDLDQKHFPASLTETCKSIFGDEQMDFYLTAIKPFQHIRVAGKENGSQLEIAIAPGDGNSLYRLLCYYGAMTK